jgi:hypothetical protein
MKEISYQIALKKLQRPYIKLNDLKSYLFPQELLFKFAYKFNLKHCQKIIGYQKVTEELLREFSKKDFEDELDWFYISWKHKLTENFIREFQHKLNWSEISQYQKLSESFIREFSDKVNWFNISTCQNISESFIEEFKDLVVWSSIGKYQLLSWGFIVKYYTLLDMERVLLNDQITEETKNQVQTFYKLSI